MVADTRNAPVGRRGLLRWLGWFAWLNGLLATAVSLRYVAYMGPLDSALAKVYLPLALYGHFAVLAALAALLVIPLTVVAPRRRAVSIVAAAAASAAVFLLLIDTVVYSYYRFHLNGYIFALLLDAGDEVIALSWVTWATACAVFAGMLLLQAIFVKIAWRIAQRNRPRRAGFVAGSVLLGCVLASHFMHIWADATYSRDITSLTRHIPAYRPSTAKSFMQRTGWVDMSEQRKNRSLKVKNSSALRYPLKPLACTVPQPQLNVLLVVIDTWRADALSETLTPNVDRFAHTYPTLKFLNHFSAGNGTRPGIFGLFYGLAASYWPAFYGSQTEPVLIRQLQDNQFELGIFASSKLTRPAFDRTVFSKVSDLRLTSDGDSAWQRDRDVLADWTSFLQTRNERRAFFGLLFFDSVHAYSFPPDYPRHFEPLWERVDHLQLNDNFDPLPYRNRYNQSLHYVDSLIGKALEDLTVRNLLDSTIVIITSDHGEAFNDQRRGYWGHGSNYTREQTQVPLLVHWPGKEAHDYSHDSSNLDLAPTLMRDLFGCQNAYSDYSNGRHLTDVSARDSLVISGYLEYGIVEPDRITVLYQSGDHDVFDRDYRPLRNAGLSPQVADVVLREMTRFYR